jgi:hypothetical protein
MLESNKAASLAQFSNQALINELNNRRATVKFFKKPQQIKDRVKLGLSPTTIVEEWDFRK